jgi:hypothetical protein
MFNNGSIFYLFEGYFELFTIIENISNNFGNDTFFYIILMSKRFKTIFYLI